jgi:hypothetical protein
MLALQQQPNSVVLSYSKLVGSRSPLGLIDLGTYMYDQLAHVQRRSRIQQSAAAVAQEAEPHDTSSIYAARVCRRKSDGDIG